MNFGGATELKASLDMNMVDSPSTTSSCTYRISMRALGGYGTTGINKGSKLIAMEIEA